MGQESTHSVKSVLTGSGVYSQCQKCTHCIRGVLTVSVVCSLCQECAHSVRSVLTVSGVYSQFQECTYCQKHAHWVRSVLTGSIAYSKCQECTHCVRSVYSLGQENIHWVGTCVYKNSNILSSFLEKNNLNASKNGISVHVKLELKGWVWNWTGKTRNVH